MYLRRGESTDSELANQEIKEILEEFFYPIPCKNREIIKTVRGIHSKSELFYSPK